MLISSWVGSDLKVTSSTIPTVKPFFGSGSFRFSNMGMMHPGVVSLELRP